MKHPLLTAAPLVLLSAPFPAQFGNAWVEFTREDARLEAAPTQVSSTTDEVDFAWGDLDQDGATDLVAARKQPFATTGKRRNLLFMNVNGVLRDRTAEFATAADVPGDLGFLTPTNDRDVELVDVDGDGWLDVVTATDISDGDPKAVGHPRVYRNLGVDATGAWLGLRFENARFPQLFAFASGLPQNPRFTGVDAADLTADGFPELYFVDHDSSGAGGAGQTPAQDLNDRLLENDGSGFFLDASQAAASAQVLQSAFGTAVSLADMNLDGATDIVKSTSLNAPQYVGVAYNSAATPGLFPQIEVVHTFSPYYVNTGDLNNDGRPDLVVTDAGTDRYRYNTGTDPSGDATFSSAKTFQFLAGGDDGFGSESLIADLDGDGWRDVVINDVDVDIASFSRRIHLYHNPGGNPGDEITLVEEREQPGFGGWLGAVGLEQSDLTGGFSTAALDLDGDGDLDLVFGRADGTFVWMNQTVPNALAADRFEIGLAAGGVQGFALDAGPAHAAELYLLLGTASGTAPGFALDGVPVPLNVDTLFLQSLTSPNLPPYATNLGTLDAAGTGAASLTVPPGSSAGLAGLLLHHAFLTVDVGGSLAVSTASNAVPLGLVP